MFFVKKILSNLSLDAISSVEPLCMNPFEFHLLSGATVGGCGDVANKGPGGIRNIFTAESEIFSQQNKELKSQRFESCICSSYCQPSVGDAGAPVFRLIPTKDLGVEGGPTERVSDRMTESVVC